jgi:hypothetical protein
MKSRKTGNQGNRQTVKQTLPRPQARQHTAAMRLKNNERMSGKDIASPGKSYRSVEPALPLLLPRVRPVPIA